MSDLYLRKVMVTIQPGSGSGRKIENLRIKFSCEKTNESSPNNCKVEIFNLSSASKGILEAKNSRLLLQAGYQDTVETIFVGDITKTVHEIDGPDIISKMEIGDGDNRFRTARIEESFPPGASTKQVFDKVIEKSGLTVGSKIGIPDSQYANGVTLSGLVRDQLSDLTKKNDLEWSIQNEVLQIIPKKSFTLDSIVLLNPKTGLIGSPHKTAKGVEFTSLLQSKFKPGGRVKIESRNLNGIFKIRKVSHEGDSHEGDFLTKCEATA